MNILEELLQILKKQANHQSCSLNKHQMGKSIWSDHPYKKQSWVNESGADGWILPETPINIIDLCGLIAQRIIYIQHAYENIQYIQVELSACNLLTMWLQAGGWTPAG